MKVQSSLSISVSNPRFKSILHCWVGSALWCNFQVNVSYLLIYYTVQTNHYFFISMSFHNWLLLCLTVSPCAQLQITRCDHQLDRGVLQHSYLGLSTPTRLGLVRDFLMTNQNLRDLMSWFSITIGNSVLAQLLPTQWSSLMRLVSLRCNSLKSISTYDSPSALILCKLVDEAKNTQVIHTSK